jgi:hypothetical protein
LKGRAHWSRGGRSHKYRAQPTRKDKKFFYDGEEEGERRDRLFSFPSYLLQDPIYIEAAINAQTAGGWGCYSQNPKWI